MMHFFIIGMVLGLSAGLAPGPLLTLVVSETIQHDIRAGIKVALAPLVTDLPIVVLTVFILSRLSGFHTVLGSISIVGGVVVMGMGIGGIRTKGLEIQIEKSRPHSLLKGVLVNVLSPHPYLFWLSVGAPTMAKANKVHLFAAVLYVIGFYLFLIGSKIVMAVLVGKSKSILKGRVYIFIMKFLGVLLCFLALFLFKDGLGLLGFFS
ncbi:MAG: LysE family transporter [Desulfobacula sp.]|nr:LysE family transporter [Desulfobacula sp.]